MVRWGISKLIDVPPKNLLCITSIPIKLEKRNKVVGRMALASLLDRVQGMSLSEGHYCGTETFCMSLFAFTQR